MTATGQIQLDLPSTKTNHLGTSIWVTRTESGTSWDAYGTLLQYHNWRITNQPLDPLSPYFIIDGGRALTKNMALRTLRRLLTKNGDNPMAYGLHSTRHGEAIALTASGAASQEVMAAGGWSSSGTLDIYAGRLTEQRLVEMQRGMHQQTGMFHATRNPEKQGRPHRSK
jgi:hypothetical protein